MKKLTVFTPTFNREGLLPRLYKSLCRQTSNDFLWLIIDDGSTDGTKELVEKWQIENRIEIKYVYKENGGMHTGHNTAYSIIETELNVCIDSDDYLTDNAVEIIIDFWNQNADEKYAGILGLDIYQNGERVSNKDFPEGVKSGKYYELRGKYGLIGDIKFVYRTDVIRQYPEYPVFPGEKLTPLGYKYLLIDQDYDMLFLNKALCVVEYQPDGSSKNIVSQYLKNPNGFLQERKVRMKLAYTFRERFTNSVHYVSCCLILKKWNIFKESTNLPMTILAAPFGIVLYFYLKFKK